MLNTEIITEHQEKQQVKIDSIAIDIEAGSSNAMVYVRSIFSIVVVWLFTFCVIMLVFIKVDHLRTYVIRDLIPVKELRDLEEKADRIMNHQIAQTFDIESPEEEIRKIQMKLNRSYNQLVSSTYFDIAKEYKRFIEGGAVCTPQSNVVFIKTHKTASSTVTNILNRYADLRELTVALPSMGDSRFAWPRKFHWSSVDLLRLHDQPANMLTNHARYNREEMDMIMEDNSKYITILRDPVTQFESSFYYFEFDRVLKLNTSANPIDAFLRFPDEHLYNLTLRLGDLPDTMNLIQSGMFYDLGFDFMDIESDDRIQEVLEKLDSEFHLVLIMEYFDESLVLLKKELCWDNDDILYIKQNQRLKHLNLTENAKDRIRTWNRADHLLYQYFNKTFWKKIENYGPMFWQEVEEFRLRNKEFERICSPEKVTMKGFKINVDVNAFVMNQKVDRFHRYLCGKVLKSEVDYLSYFRTKFRADFGYQKLLIAEGLKPVEHERRLQKKLKSKAQIGPKFLKLKGFER